MNTYKKFSFLIFGFLFITLLTGCGKTTEEKIYDKLENVVKLEDEFKNQQTPLVELEKKEREIYDTILSLGLKEHARISELADEAIQVSEQREELIQKERDSIKEAKEEFDTVNDLIEKIQEEKLKGNAENLYKLMEQRYAVHDKLYDKYTSGMTEDRQLYKLLKEKDVSLEKLQPQIEKINAIYKEVYELNDQFNELTKEYNEKKIDFYKEAGINIDVKKE